MAFFSANKLDIKKGFPNGKPFFMSSLNKPTQSRIQRDGSF